MKQRTLKCFLGGMAALLAVPARADDAAAKRELAPQGKLRVAIAVGPAPSALYTIKDGAGYRGVTIVLCPIRSPLSLKLPQ